jgi:hypothetical protein
MKWMPHQAGALGIENLARKLAASAKETAKAGTTSWPRIQTCPKDKVATWLEAGENSWLKELEGKERFALHVRRAGFAGGGLGLWPALRADPGVNTTDLGAALNRAAQGRAQQSVDAVIW